VRAVDIVIPVYDGLEETRRCLDTVLATVDCDWARLVVVNDCSPNPLITTMLRQLAQQHNRMVLLENDTNLGFVATANRGMQYDPQRDILLLNSDVEVAGNWLQRMREAAYASDRIGSLTPFSNNATICSFPNFCRDNRLLFGLPLAEIDDCFADLGGAGELFQVPTGIGFCMYMRRDCLADTGYFDVDTFGRGYGEENDWCQRAQQAGWGNYHLGNCFVYHKGGVSFGAEQNPRVATALELLAKKHPRYHASVQSYLETDPARALRTAVLLRLFAAQNKPKVAFLTHKLGGGSQQHVDELAGLYRDQALFLQLTPDKDGSSVTLSVFDHGERLQDGLYFDVEAEYDKLVSLLKELGVGRVHFHHTMGLHPRLWLLARDLGCTCDLTIHDYYLINSNPTLTDGAARFVTDLAPDFDQRCAEHYPLPEGVSAANWRQSQRLLVEGADRVIFPSADCQQRFSRFFQVQNPVTAWHPDFQLSQPYPEPRWPDSAGRALRVLVLGAISREKGADLLEAVAGSLREEALEFHLLGYAYKALEGGVVTHGPYSQADVYNLVADINPDLVWFPALWPETYSYTLSIALHLGLPVVVPDIGAFVERVIDRPLSVICPWDRTPGQWQTFWAEVSREKRLPAATGEPNSLPPLTTPELDFYRADYLRGIEAIIGEVSEDTLAGLAGHYHAGLPRLTAAERALGRIWRMSRSPLAAKLVSLVPFRLQQALKRRLSSRPMHDIVRGE
jgi:GT2 family glycosyltransferase/glycosyltransferase involved in cell wall biosynthesis